MTAGVGRLIVVLGYSDGTRDELHPVCAERVAHAATIATDVDVVVLSGWARVPGHRPEAELMAEAWRGPACELVIDPDAQTTVGNALNALDDVHRTGAREVVVVTSSWHARRAGAAFRWILRPTGTSVVTATPESGGSLVDRLGELPRWVLLPVQVVLRRSNVAGRAIEPAGGWRRLLGRGAMLLLGSVSLYLVAPAVLEVFSSWSALRALEPRWFALVAAAQVGTLVCLWAVQRLALHTTLWTPVITSQLAGNAASRLVPGGAAAGTAVQFRLLRSAGIGTETAVSGLAVAGLLQLAATLVLLIVALPGVVIGGPVPAGLLRVAWAGTGLFVFLVVLAVAIVADDRLLRWAGRLVELVRRQGLPGRGTSGDRMIAQRDALVARFDGHWFRATVFTAGRSAFDYLCLVMAIAAFGGEGRLSLILLAYASSALLGLIPITPGGLGFVEAGLTGTLTLAGLPAATAVGAALLYRLFSFWLPIPAGLLAGLYHRQRYS